MSLNSIVIIPARLGSSRFPGKPLALIEGQTMISRVYNNSIKSRLSTTTVVATPDPEILTTSLPMAVVQFSLPTPTRASDRCAEALLAEREDSIRYHSIVMVRTTNHWFVIPRSIRR